MNLTQLERIKTELKQGFYRENKIQGLNCEKPKLPGVKLQETEGKNLVKRINLGSTVKNTKAKPRVLKPERLGFKLQEKGPGSNYFRTAEVSICKTRKHRAF